MPTVMARLHLESRRFDCRASAWPLAPPRTMWNVMTEGTVNTNAAHTSLMITYTACARKHQRNTETSLLPCHLSDVPKGSVERHPSMWRRPVGESDVSQLWQDRLGTALSQRAASPKHMQGTCASLLIHRCRFICPCWDQGTEAVKDWVI